MIIGHWMVTSKRVLAALGGVLAVEPGVFGILRNILGCRCDLGDLFPQLREVLIVHLQLLGRFSKLSTPAAKRLGVNSAHLCVMLSLCVLRRMSVVARSVASRRPTIQLHHPCWQTTRHIVVSPLASVAHARSFQAHVAPTAPTLGPAVNRVPPTLPPTSSRGKPHFAAALCGGIVGSVVSGLLMWLWMKHVERDSVIRWAQTTAQQFADVLRLERDARKHFVAANASTKGASLLCIRYLEIARLKLESLRQQCTVNGAISPQRVKAVLIAGARARAQDMGEHATSKIGDLSDQGAVEKFNDLHAHLLYQLGCCHFMQNEWVEANEFLKQSQAVPSTWRALEAAEQPQEVRTKCADLNIVSAWRRKEVEASYRAMLQEYRSVDLVSARVKNHLAVASYAWAYTTDANAVEMIEDCIADVAKLCRPALCVLADATRTKSACAALGDILAIKDDGAVPVDVSTQLAEVFAVGEASVVDVLFQVTQTTEDSAKSHRRLQEELERTKLTWRKAVTARCNVLQFISAAVIPGDSLDAERFDAKLVMKMLQELTGIGASPPVLHDLYVLLDATWLYQRANVVRVLVALASGLEVLLRHGRVPEASRRQAERVALDCLAVARKERHLAGLSYSTRVYLESHAFCLSAFLASPSDRPTMLTNAANILDQCRKRDQRNERQRLWVNAATLLLARRAWSQERTDSGSLDSRFNAMVQEHDNAAALKRCLKPGDPVDSVELQRILDNTSALVAKCRDKLAK